MAPTRRWLVLLAFGSVAFGCGRKSSTESGPPAVVPVPPVVPAGLQVDKYVGAAACKDCHEKQYEAWRTSPHGLAMTEPGAGNLRGKFDGVAVAAPGGKVVPFVRDGSHWMRIESTGGPTEEHKVDLVLGYGRQHQTYLTRLPDGNLRLMPLFWTTLEGRWVPTDLYTHGSLDPKDGHYWYVSDMMKLACTSCHLSQGHFQFAEGLYRPRWVDLSINCEACHGPGAEHVEKRLAGEVDTVYRDLHAISKEEDAELCGQCHGRHQPFYLQGSEPWRQPRMLVTLDTPDLRVDGTQHMPNYQIGGHLLSRCYQDGSMTCASCHTPHSAKARSLVGEDAEGEHSNRQCTVCHRDRVDAKLARQHSRHTDEVKCVDCHMSMSWMGETPERQQRTADHTIQIPRPAEAAAFGTPNACTTCHEDKNNDWALAALREWGYENALEVRPWVAAIHAGRESLPGATDKLLAVLDDPTAGEYLKQSALDLLKRQKPDARVIAKVEPFVASTNPQTRASAIAALLVHDEAGAEKWRKRGSADEHPYVRYVAYSRARDIKALTKEEMLQVEVDVASFAIVPFDLLGMVSDAYLFRGEDRRALAVVESAGAFLSPVQRVVLGLSDRRQRLLQRGAGPR